MRMRDDRYELRRDAAVREAKEASRSLDVLGKESVVELVERGDGNGEVAEVAITVVVEVELGKERFGKVGEAGASEAASEVLLP